METEITGVVAHTREVWAPEDFEDPRSNVSNAREAGKALNPTQTLGIVFS